MNLSRRWRRFASQVALLAVALHAGWPLLAQAKPRVPELVVPLCTAQGVSHSVELPANGGPPEGQAAAHHCDLCVAGAAASAVPSPVSANSPPAAGSVAVVAAAGARAHVSLSHPPAQPRAPPARA